MSRGHRFLIQPRQHYLYHLPSAGVCTHPGDFHGITADPILTYTAGNQKNAEV